MLCEVFEEDFFATFFFDDELLLECFAFDDELFDELVECLAFDDEPFDDDDL